MDGGTHDKDATNVTDTMYHCTKCVNGAMKEYFVKIASTHYKIWDAHVVYHICLTLLSMHAPPMKVVDEKI